VFRHGRTHDQARSPSALGLAIDASSVTPAKWPPHVPLARLVTVGKAWRTAIACFYVRTDKHGEPRPACAGQHNPLLSYRSRRLILLASFFLPRRRFALALSLLPALRVPRAPRSRWLRVGSPSKIAGESPAARRLARPHSSLPAFARSPAPSSSRRQFLRPAWCRRCPSTGTNRSASSPSAHSPVPERGRRPRRTRR
jgi:hypothetical protein